MNKLTRSESDDTNSESYGNMTSSEEEPTSSDEEGQPPTPPPEQMGRSESSNLLKHCLADNYFQGKKSQTQHDPFGTWEDIAGLSGYRSQNKRSNPKRNKHTFNSKSDNSKDEFVFHHYSNSREYLEQYRNDHTVGGVGQKHEGVVIGSRTHDPYMTKLKSISRSSRPKTQKSLLPTRSKSPSRTTIDTRTTSESRISSDIRTLPLIRQASSCPGSVGRTLLTVNPFGPILHVQGSGSSPEQTKQEAKETEDTSNKCSFRRFKDFQALVDRTAQKSASKLEVVSDSSENLSLAKKDPSKKTSIRPSSSHADKKRLDDVGKTGSKSDLGQKSHNQSDRIDVNSSPISKSFMDFTKRQQTESSNSLDTTSRMCLPVGVCDVYSTSSDSASVPSKYSSSVTTIYTPNPIYKPLGPTHFSPKLKQKHACSRKVSLQNGACRNEKVGMAVNKTDTVKTRYAIQPS